MCRPPTSEPMNRHDPRPSRVATHNYLDELCPARRRYRVIDYRACDRDRGPGWRSPTCRASTWMGRDARSQLCLLRYRAAERHLLPRNSSSGLSTAWSALFLDRRLRERAATMNRSRGCNFGPPKCSSSPWTSPKSLSTARDPRTLPTSTPRLPLTGTNASCAFTNFTSPLTSSAPPAKSPRRRPHRTANRVTPTQFAVHRQS